MGLEPHHGSMPAASYKFRQLDILQLAIDALNRCCTLKRSCRAAFHAAQGVDHFGQTGTVNDLYQHYRLDTDSLVETALAMTPGRQPFADFQRVAS